MKLAEALLLRADLEKKIASLRERIAPSALRKTPSAGPGGRTRPGRHAARRAAQPVLRPRTPQPSTRHAGNRHFATRTATH